MTAPTVKRPVAPAFGKLSPQQMLGLVQKLVNPGLDRERAILERQRLQDAETARRQREAIQGFAGARADLLRPVAGEIEQTYKAAGDKTAAWAKGFSMAMQKDVDASASQINSLLQQGGSPQQVQSGGQGAADVLYGTAGLTPATALSNAGSAFSAAARFLPDTAIERGRLDANANLDAATRQNEDYRAKERDIAAKRPELLQAALVQIAGLDNQARATEIQESYLLLNAAKAYGQDQNGNPLAGYYKAQDGTIVPAGYTYNPTTGTITKAYEPGGKNDPAVKQRTAFTNRSNALLAAGQSIMETGPEWLGKPLTNPKPGQFVNTGKFLTPDGKTTNDPAKAAREGSKTWAEAYRLAYETIGGDELRARFALTDAKLRALIERKLLALGFKRPAGKAARPPLPPKRPSTVRGGD